MSDIYVFGLLDNDLYKFTMQNAVLRLYPNNRVCYEFINRGKHKFPDGFGKRLRELVDTLREYQLTKDEKGFLREKCYYLPPAYLDFLDGYKFDPNEVHIEQIDSELNCKVTGLWYRTILWEVPLMSLISQLYFEMTNQTAYSRESRADINSNKNWSFRNSDIIEMGTRRRFSFQNQDEVIKDLKNGLKGTSNVYFAMKHDMIPMGTMAHEWVQYHAARYGFLLANEMSLKAWVDVYQNNLRTALPDTFTTNAYLRTLSPFYANIFNTLRQDSGDPKNFVEKVENRYKELKVAPVKEIIFSNNIKSVEEIKKIENFCGIRGIKSSFGIGTWLTNNVGVEPLNIVIKMVACNIKGLWVGAVKLSDDKGKYTGNQKTIKYCRYVLDIND